ncbi:MAG: tRNA preQ1(34) S-adenosylmethionine ribosyltransferase-isomerase QueA [Thermotogae bacterium]|nr:tRNA preQ1(34) S-adenosylmethionine ribosyltransferase-isomerase QueA [Thermotogota bacterium]
MSRTTRERGKTRFLDITVPPERIATRARPKGTSRLLVIDREPFRLRHRRFSDLPDILKEEGSPFLVILNDTKVIKAMLPMFKPSGRRVLVLFVERTPYGFKGMVKGRMREGWILRTPKGREAKVLGRDEEGYVLLEMEDVFTVLEEEGRMPIPPYMGREPTPEDEEYYQTVYARNPGSIAAPTAGLHFTPEIIERLKEEAVDVLYITLHVGVGTFKPVKDIRTHRMEREYYRIPEDVARRIEEHRRRGGKVLAVGTTTTRALESWALTGLREGYTDLFIKPPYDFKVVDALLTNFHLPDGTPILLTMAFAGEDVLKRAYEEALRRDYLFFSYGDATLIL